MSTESVSIVINNYNYGRFLAEAIESALSQTWEQTEVIVVDDGSTDDSRDVISRYQGRVKSVLKENGGQGSAFNAGFSVCRGDAVCFLDADDGIYPHAIERAVSLLQGTRTSKAHWQLVIVDEVKSMSGKTFPPEPMPDGDFRERTLRDGPFYDARILPPTSGNIWTRQFLERVLPMPEGDFDHGADVYLHALAPLYGAMRALHEPQGFYRAHGQNHYWRNGLSDRKVTEYLNRFLSCCSALAEQIRNFGEAPDVAGWKARSFNYLWLTRLQSARQDLARLIPLGAKYILVDGNEWGGVGVADHIAVPFLERDGEYWGPPADDTSALHELKNARDQGVTHFALWWTSYWWIAQYPVFWRYLEDHFSCVLKSNHMTIYDLRD